MSENVWREGGRGMPKDEEKLTWKQEKALSALLSHSSLKDAASVAGVSEKTLWRWMQLPHFAERLRAAQRAALDDAILELQAASIRAVRKLIANMDAENVFASNAAALAVLSNSLKAREQGEIMSRIERLQTMLEALERGKKWA